MSRLDFQSAQSYFLQYFYTHPNLNSLKVEFDYVSQFATFSATSSLPIDNFAMESFNSQMLQDFSATRIFYFYNDLAASQPVHLYLTTVKVPEPTNFMVEIKDKLTLQRFALNNSSYVIQQFFDGWVLVFFHSLENNNSQVKNLVAQSLGDNFPVFSFEI